MQKVLNRDFRKTKEITLPISGITIECYSSILVSDIADMKVDGNDMSSNIELVLKVIKGWNFFEKEEDTDPLPLTPENFSKIPAPDFQFLVQEMEAFGAEQKKSTLN